MGAQQLSYGLETGSITSDLNGLLEAAGGAAAWGTLTTAQHFAELGSDLATIAEESDAAANGQGSEAADIFAALTSLVEAQQQYNALGGLSGIEKDIAALWDGFISNLVGTSADLTVGGIYGSDNAQEFIPKSTDSKTPGWTPIIKILPNGQTETVGMCLLDLTDPNNQQILNTVENAVNNGDWSGKYIVLGHGSTGTLENTSSSPLGTQPTQYFSAEGVANTLLSNSTATGYTLGQSIVVFGCDAGATPGIDDPYYAVEGNAAGQNFAQTLSNSLGNPPVFNGAFW